MISDLHYRDIMTTNSNDRLRRKKYWLETYGCQMNKAESSALEIDLLGAGYIPARDSADADLVVLNTCSVRKTAEDRVWGRLGFFRYLKTTKDFRLAVIGCMSERLKAELGKTVPEIDLIVGTFEKRQFVEALERSISLNEPQIKADAHEYAFAPLHSKGTGKAFLPIMHGCNNFCSYCIVPHVRGPEISRSPDAILAELHQLEERGVKEVTLLGQNVNSYRFSEQGRHVDFPALLKIIDRELSGIRWVRFLTSHPKDCTQELIDLIASRNRFCRQLHLPVQHGSNRILSLMNRGYTREEYLTLVKIIKKTISDVSITTDILIGFPTERTEDVELTKALMEEVEFDDAYTYYYNPREGTQAFALGDAVAEEEKLKRLREVIDLTRRLKARRQRRRLGSSVPVLVEDVSKKARHELLGRTEHDEMVVFEGARELIGRFVDVTLETVQGTTFRGKSTTLSDTPR